MKEQAMLDSKTIITQLLEDITLYRSLRSYEDPRIVALMDKADYRQNITLFLWKLYHKFFDQSGQLKANALGTEALFNDMLQSLIAVEDPEFYFLNANEQEQVLEIHEEIKTQKALQEEKQALRLITGKEEATWEDAVVAAMVKTNDLVKHHLQRSNIKAKLQSYYQKFDEVVALDTQKREWFLQDLVLHKRNLEADITRYRISQKLLNLKEEGHRTMWQAMSRFIGGLKKLIQKIDRFSRAVRVLATTELEHRFSLKALILDAAFPVEKIELASQLFTQPGMTQAQFNRLISKGEIQENFTHRSHKSA